MNPSQMRDLLERIATALEAGQRPTARDIAALKLLVKELLERVLAALEAGEFPTVQDAADLELLCLEYWDKDASPQALGLTTRVAHREPVERLSKAEVQSIVNHLVCRKQHPQADHFAALLRHYLAGHLTAADLLGERHRKVRNDQGWQYYDQLGELAEWVRQQLAEKGVRLLTGKRSLGDRTDRNLYDLLAALPSQPVDVIRKRFKIPATVDLESIKEKLGSNHFGADTWLTYHEEFKKGSQP